MDKGTLVGYTGKQITGKVFLVAVGLGSGTSSFRLTELSSPCAHDDRHACHYIRKRELRKPGLVDFRVFVKTSHVAGESSQKGFR